MFATGDKDTREQATALDALAVAGRPVDRAQEQAAGGRGGAGREGPDALPEAHDDL